MGQISIYSDEYREAFKEAPLPSERVKAALGESPKIYRDANGRIDEKKTLANSPITRLIAEEESRILRAAGHSVNDNALSQLDAFERRMYAAGIRGDMDIATAMTSFYRPESIGLFPEFIERNVLLSENTLVGDQVTEADLVGMTTNITGKSVTATKLALDGTTATGDRKMRQVVEGALSRTYTLAETKETVTLQEYGFSLKISDWAKTTESVDQLALITQELAAQEINIQCVSDALDVLIAAGYTEVETAASDAITWTDILKFMYSDKLRFSPDFLVTSAYADSAAIDLTTIMNLAQFTDPTGNPGNATQDKIPTPRGRALKCHEGTKLQDKLVGIRKNLALRKYENRMMVQSEWERQAKAGGADIYHYRINRGYYRFEDSAVRILVPAT